MSCGWSSGGPPDGEHLLAAHLLAELPVEGVGRPIEWQDLDIHLEPVGGRELTGLAGTIPSGPEEAAADRLSSQRLSRPIAIPLTIRPPGRTAAASGTASSVDPGRQPPMGHLALP